MTFLDAAFGVIGFYGIAGAAISVAYFVSNILIIGATGKDIGQHIEIHISKIHGQ